MSDAPELWTEADLLAEICAGSSRRERMPLIIAAEMARVAKAPADERRQVIDVREGLAALTECAVACACAAPVALAYVVWMALY